MVMIALEIYPMLENIAEFKPAGPEFKWYLKFRCNNCGEVTEKWNYVSLSEPVPASKGHAQTHIVVKCKLCSRKNSLTILDDSIKPFVANNDNYQAIVVFDCRGLEPCDFMPRTGWIAKAVDDGKEFTDVDLTEGEWADYCDKIKQPVGIYNVQHTFQRVI